MMKDFFAICIVLTLLGCTRADPDTLITLAPLLAEPSQKKSKIEEHPEVKAQRIFNQNRRGLASVGPEVLSRWASNSRELLIFDLNGERRRNKFGIIPNSIPISSKLKDLSILQLDLKTKVRVFIGMGEDETELKKAIRVAEDAGCLRNYILGGGIEAWARYQDSLSP